MNTICKIAILTTFLLSFNLVFAQKESSVELFIRSGIEHSFIKYIPRESNPHTSGWRTSQNMNGNFNFASSLGLNFNTRKKIQIQTGISYSNPSFDALDANVVHTVSAGAFSLGILPYTEKRDFQIKFRFFQLNLGLGLPIKVTNKFSIIVATSTTLKLLSDYKWKEKSSLEDWKDVEYYQNNSFVFKDLPIFGIIASVEARHHLNDNESNRIDLTYGINYSYDFSSPSSWGEIYFRSIGFDVGVVIPFKNKKHNRYPPS